MWCGFLCEEEDDEEDEEEEEEEEMVEKQSGSNFDRKRSLL